MIACARSPERADRRAGGGRPRAPAPRCYRLRGRGSLARTPPRGRTASYRLRGRGSGVGVGVAGVTGAPRGPAGGDGDAGGTDGPPRPRITGKGSEVGGGSGGAAVGGAARD